jgi:hypothetical protein
MARIHLTVDLTRLDQTDRPGFGADPAKARLSGC